VTPDASSEEVPQAVCELFGYHASRITFHPFIPVIQVSSLEI